MKRTYSIICASHNEETLNKGLLASHNINDHQLIIRMGCKNVPATYNSAAKHSKHDIEIYVHHDVILKKDFFKTLDYQLDKLEEIDKNWGVVGVAGARWTSRFAAYVLDREGQSFLRWTDEPEPYTWFKEEDFPYRVQTLDELILIKRKGDLRFDESIPSSHHLFGADLCMQAWSTNRSNYIVNALCQHNSHFDGNVDESFYRASSYLARKWSNQNGRNWLPIFTTVTHIWDVPPPRIGPQNSAPINIDNIPHLNLESL
jgi:hypothetical protein